MFEVMEKFVNQIDTGKCLSVEQALQILTAEGSKLTAFMAGAQRLKEKYCGSRIDTCSIINAKSGYCSENCSFCAQSIHNKTSIKTYPLRSVDDILQGAIAAQALGSQCYGIVTSGTRIEQGEEFEQLLTAIRKIRQKTTITPSASIGILDCNSANALYEAGCGTYHHNLETARSYFGEVCTTHSYDENVDTIKFAKETGMQVCCGGLFGLGESLEQRVELGLTLRSLEVDSVPINFLNPVAGTPLEGREQLTPLDCLRIICLYRYLLPDKKITVCGGRDKNMRDFQSAIFMAGASGVMIGNYLTTSGRNGQIDRQMLQDAEGIHLAG